MPMKGLRRNDDAMKYQCWYLNQQIKKSINQQSLNTPVAVKMFQLFTNGI
jgi:hypothetical protein